MTPQRIIVTVVITLVLILLWAWGQQKEAGRDTLRATVAHDKTFAKSAIDLGRPKVAGKFDEASYLKGNPDVAEAVAKKVIKSGYDHWTSFGKNENRCCSGIN